MCRFHLMGRVRAISDEFTFNRYSDFQLMSIVWAKHKAFVLVRPTCHFLIKLFCVGGNEALQATSEQCVRNSWVGEKLLPYRRATEKRCQMRYKAESRGYGELTEPGMCFRQLVTGHPEAGVV